MKPFKGTPPGTPTRNPRAKPRSKKAVSPAAQDELPTRALRKSPHKRVRMMAPVTPVVESDVAASSDSIISEKTLVATPAKKSCQRHLRSSDKHPLLEQSGSKDDSTPRQEKAVRSKILDISTEEIRQLPACSPQTEVQEGQDVEDAETPVETRQTRQARPDDD